MRGYSGRKREERKKKRNNKGGGEEAHNKETLISAGSSCFSRTEFSHQLSMEKGNKSPLTLKWGNEINQNTIFS